MNLLTTAQRYVSEAIEKHESFRQHVQSAKQLAFDTGIALLNAQASLGENETLEELLTPHVDQNKISRRSAFYYMRFAQDMMSWAQIEDPRLKRPDAIQTRARELVMESAKTFLALMREAAGVLRPEEGGGHRSAKSASGGNSQLFFSFDVFKDAFWGLEHLHFAPIRELAQTNRVELEETVERARKFVAAADEALSEKDLPRVSEVEGASPEEPSQTSPLHGQNDSASDSATLKQIEGGKP